MRRSQQHNPMVDMMQYQLDASIHLADAMFSGTEKIDRAVLDVTHQAVHGQLKLVRAVADMRDPSKLAELQVAIAGRPEKAMHCQQQIMAALVEMQAEFGRSVRNYLDRLSQTAVEQAGEASEQLSAGAQGQSDPMLNPFTGMISVWEQALREASQLANQNMLMARSGVESATSAAREAVNRTMESGGTAVNGHGHGHGHKGRTASKHK